MKTDAQRKEALAWGEQRHLGSNEAGVSCHVCALHQAVSFVTLSCLECHRVWHYPSESYEGQGVFNVFCGEDCEDRYAFRQ